MALGTLRRLAVLASLSLLVSGQLCMLTACVPRLREAGASAAHACCRTDPAQRTPEAPVPRGAMPCEQPSHVADAPTLTAPEPLAAAPMLAVEPAPAPAPAPVREELGPAPDAGPLPGRDGPATAGLRAPPGA